MHVLGWNDMEVTTISENAVKIRGKYTALAINPSDIKTKIAVSSALFFNRLHNTLSAKSFEEEPLVIQGPGDYAVGGVKVFGSKAGQSFTYKITIDGNNILAAKTSSLTKAKESVTEYDILILESDSIADQSVLTALNSKVIVFYGEQKAENIKAMGKETPAVSKYSVTKEKLPTETQVII